MITREIAEMAIKCLGDSSVTKGADGETFLVSSPEINATVEKEPEERLAKSLEQLITLARVVKGKPIDKSKLALVGTATSLLNEIITDNDQVPSEGRLKNFTTWLKSWRMWSDHLVRNSEAIVKETGSKISRRRSENKKDLTVRRITRRGVTPASGRGKKCLHRWMK